jgi:hypothetical protein
LKNDPGNRAKPEYYIHFTVEEYKDGFYRTLDYESDPRVKDFPCELQVIPGHYLVVTGNRVNEGTVLASLDFFDLPVGGKTEVTLSLRNDPSPLPVYGKVDLAAHFASVPKHGIVVAFIEPDKEPTKHLLADLVTKKKELEKWKGTILLVAPSEREMKALTASRSRELPANCTYSFQQTFPVTGFKPFLKTAGKSLPAVIYINQKGEVNFVSEGYRIGTGDELVKLTAVPVLP